jgi:23S rRNA pseudouridine1911/1915/1917 synthase
MHSDSHDYSRAALDDPGDDGGDDIDSAAECITLDADGAAGERLDRFVARRLPQFSRTRLQRWIAIGAVRCDLRPAAAKRRLLGTERIEVEPQPLEAELAFVPEPVTFSVVHEDAALFVIDKPPGLVVHPAAGNWHGTLLNGLLALDPRQAELPRAGIVHRLDKDTSGLLVVARTEPSRMALASQLADRSMSRRYLALALGRCPPTATIEAPIGRDRGNRLRMAVVEAARGRAARTDCVLLAVGRIGERDVSLVECRLQTGRTHQIRVHLRSIGHPLLGDSLYGGPAGDPWPARQMLHAWQLSFVHPDTGETCRFDRRPPPDFLSCARAAGLDGALAAAIGSVAGEAGTPAAVAFRGEGNAR